jgi:hypothetical protein
LSRQRKGPPRSITKELLEPFDTKIAFQRHLELVYTMVLEGLQIWIFRGSQTEPQSRGSGMQNLCVFTRRYEPGLQNPYAFTRKYEPGAQNLCISAMRYEPGMQNPCIFTRSYEPGMQKLCIFRRIYVIFGFEPPAKRTPPKYHKRAAGAIRHQNRIPTPSRASLHDGFGRPSDLDF